MAEGFQANGGLRSGDDASDDGTASSLGRAASVANRDSQRALRGDYSNVTSTVLVSAPIFST
jgi:hypothetical protein